jgi:hypothetical protein
VLVLAGISHQTDRPRRLRDSLTDAHFAVSSNRLKSGFVGISGFDHLKSEFSVPLLTIKICGLLGLGVLGLAVQQKVLSSVLPHSRVSHGTGSSLHEFSFLRAFFGNDLTWVFFL